MTLKWLRDHRGQWRCVYCFALEGSKHGPGCKHFAPTSASTTEATNARATANTGAAQAVAHEPINTSEQFIPMRPAKAFGCDSRKGPALGTLPVTRPGLLGLGGFAGSTPERSTARVALRFTRAALHCRDRRSSQDVAPMHPDAGVSGQPRASTSTGVC